MVAVLFDRSWVGTRGSRVREFRETFGKRKEITYPGKSIEYAYCNFGGSLALSVQPARPKNIMLKQFAWHGSQEEPDSTGGRLSASFCRLVSQKGEDVSKQPHAQ